MMATHHPEGDAGCPGGRIRYWIRSSVHGVLGGFTVGAASWHHKARDLHIGWSQAARDANIGRVVNNDRFLLLPGVRVRGLASRALPASSSPPFHAIHAPSPVSGLRPLAAPSPLSCRLSPASRSFVLHAAAIADPTLEAP